MVRIQHNRNVINRGPRRLGYFISSVGQQPPNQRFHRTAPPIGGSAGEAERWASHTNVMTTRSFLFAVLAVFAQFAEAETPQAKQRVFKIPLDQAKVIIPGQETCLASDEITVQGKKVGYMYREEPQWEGDSGWRFWAGTKTEHVGTINPKEVAIYAVNFIANYDPDIVPFLSATRLCQFKRAPLTGPLTLTEESRPWCAWASAAQPGVPADESRPAGEPRR